MVAQHNNTSIFLGCHKKILHETETRRHLQRCYTRNYFGRQYIEITKRSSHNPKGPGYPYRACIKFRKKSIKRLAFDKGKIDTVLKAIYNKFTQDGRLDSDLVAKIVLQIADMAMKKNLGLEELAPSIQRKYNELNALDEEIKNKKKFIRELRKAEIHALDKNNTTRKELNQSIPT